MLFKQRMDEIEKDILPFGFVDDGIPDIIAPAEAKSGWSLDHVWEPDY